MSSPWARSHARVACPAVALWRRPISFSLSTNFNTLGKFSYFLLSFGRNKKTARSLPAYIHPLQSRRGISANITCLECFRSPVAERKAHICPSKKSPSKRGICNNFDPQFACSLQDINLRVFDVKCERCVFGLDSRNWVNGMCSTLGVWLRCTRRGRGILPFPP